MKYSDDKSMYQELSNCCIDLQVISRTKELVELRAEFLFPEDFVGFAGHFPGQPILPAISQFAMVRLASERGLEQKLMPQAFVKTKFTGVVQPGDRPSVTVRLERINGNWAGKFRISRRGGLKISAGEIRFCS